MVIPSRAALVFKSRNMGSGKSSVVLTRAYSHQNAKTSNVLVAAGDSSIIDDQLAGIHRFAVARAWVPVFKASLVAPLVIIPISALIAVPVLFLTGSPKEAGTFILLYSAYGLLVAYASLLVVGLPAYFLARWLDAVSYPAALIAAAVACMIAGSLPDGRSLNVMASLILFAFGGPIAVVFVRIVRRESILTSLRRLLESAFG